MGTGEFTAGGRSVMDQYPIQGEHGNRDDGRVGSHADLTFLT